MGRVTKVLEQPAAGGHVYCTNAGSGTRNLADRRQPFLEHSAYLCALKAAADGIDHLHPRRVAVSTKSDPIRNVNLSRERSEEHTSELQSLAYLVCRLLLEKKKKKQKRDLRDYTSEH